MAAVASFKLLTVTPPARYKYSKQVIDKASELLAPKDSGRPQAVKQSKLSLTQNNDLPERLLIETRQHQLPRKLSQASLNPPLKSATVDGAISQGGSFSGDMLNTTEPKKSSSIHQKPKIFSHSNPETYPNSRTTVQKQVSKFNNTKIADSPNETQGSRKSTLATALTKPSLRQGNGAEWRNYGPFQVEWTNWQPMEGGSIVARSFNGEGKPVYLAVNCGTRKLNITSQSVQWMSWKSPQLEHEKLLLEDICRDLK